jgi:hypothetical protein
MPAGGTASADGRVGISLLPPERMAGLGDTAGLGRRRRGESRSVVLPSGTHLVYLPLIGPGNVVSARFDAAAGLKPLCVAGVAMGLVYPDQAGRAIPVAPVTG